MKLDDLKKLSGVLGHLIFPGHHGGASGVASRI